MTFRSHKIRIYPNKSTQLNFIKAFGVSRFVYNWALEQCLLDYNNGLVSPSGYALSRRLNSIKKDSFPWMYEVSKWVAQKSLFDLADAFSLFFRKKAKHPKFKKLGRCVDSFYVNADSFIVDGRKVKLPKVGWVRMSQQLRFSGKIKSAVISRTSSGKFYIAIQVKLSEDYIYPHRCENQASVGVDVGVKDLAVLSDGTRYENPKALRSHLRKLKRLQRSLSRKQKGFQNRSKAKQKLSRLHLRIRNIRQDAIHKMTSEIVRNFRFIGVEDLYVSGMLKNHKLAQSVQDASFYEIRRQLTYKSSLSGSEIMPIDRWYPSSKICSMCGWKNEAITLGDREWRCKDCGMVHDRDVNAAKNIEKVALGGRETINACGGEVRHGYQYR